MNKVYLPSFFVRMPIIMLGFVFLIFQTSIVFSQSTGDTPAEKEIIVLLKRAIVLMNQNIDSAHICAERALVMAQNSGLKLMELRANSLKGEIYQSMSDYKSSIIYYLEAIKIGEANDLENSLGPSYNGIGLDYYYLKDFEKADKYLKKAAAAKLARGDVKYYAAIMGNLASIYIMQGKHEEALQLLSSIEPTLLTYNDDESLSAMYIAMGSIQQMNFKNLDSATYYYQKGLEFAAKKDLRKAQIAPYHNLGQIKLLKGEFRAAVGYLEKSMALCKEAGSDAILIGIYNTLSELYDSIGNYQKAYEYKFEQQILSDSVFAKDKQQAVQELEIKYQTAKNKEQLRKQNEEIQAQQLVYERIRFMLLALLFLLVLASFIAYYFWQRKQANQRLEKEKSKIFQNIVHEIRTPLTLIRGPLFQLKKQYLIPDEEQNWKLIEVNSNRLMQMVNELLDASKLEKGKYQLAYQHGDVPWFIGEILAQFEPTAQEKEINIHYHISDKIPPLRFAANAIERVLSNLVLNSLKYCPAKSSINIDLNWQNGQLFLVVSDNGPGIPEKEQKKIFERFYRIENQKNVGGTGIGLSIVKDLVDLMRGKIHIDSKQGKGLRVEISMPTEVYEVFKSDENVNADRKPTLLIVEDNPDILAFATNTLKEDFHVLQATDGVEGVEKALEYIPHLILTDIMMPRKDGITLLSELKDNQLTSHIPILVFSAKNALESRLQGLAAGADAYLPKPFHPEELLLLTKNIWHTIQKNQQEYQAVVQGEQPFDLRIKSESDYVNKAIDLILAHIDDPNYSVNELANELFISRSQLHRKLDALTGMSTTQFIKMIRLEKAKDLLRANLGNITEIAYQCGFSSASYFTRSFKEYFGEAPSHFLNK